MTLHFMDGRAVLSPIQGGVWSRIGQIRASANLALGTMPSRLIVAAIHLQRREFVLDAVQPKVSAGDRDLLRIHEQVASSGFLFVREQIRGRFAPAAPFVPSRVRFELGRKRPIGGSQQLAQVADADRLDEVVIESGVGCTLSIRFLSVPRQRH
jgi:hypothetical protein